MRFWFKNTGKKGNVRQKKLVILGVHEFKGFTIIGDIYKGDSYIHYKYKRVF